MSALISLAPNAQQWFRVDEGGADASGNVIGQRLEWLPEMIPALGRAYFEIPKMPPAAQYRVTVWSYDRLKGGSGA